MRVGRGCSTHTEKHTCVNVRRHFRSISLHISNPSTSHCGSARDGCETLSPRWERSRLSLDQFLLVMGIMALWREPDLMAPFLSESRSNEPFKTVVQKSRFLRGRGYCEIITRIMIDCIARNLLLLNKNGSPQVRLGSLRSYQRAVQKNRIVHERHITSFCSLE